MIDFAKPPKGAFRYRQTKDGNMPHSLRREVPSFRTPLVAHLPAAIVPYELTSVLPQFLDPGPPNRTISNLPVDAVGGVLLPDQGLQAEGPSYPSSHVPRGIPTPQKHPEEVLSVVKSESRVPTGLGRLSKPLRPPQPMRTTPPVPRPGIDNDTACNSPPVLCVDSYTQWENWDTWAPVAPSITERYSYAEPVPLAIHPLGLQTIHTAPSVPQARITSEADTDYRGARGYEKRDHAGSMPVLHGVRSPPRASPAASPMTRTGREVLQAGYLM